MTLNQSLVDILVKKSKYFEKKIKSKIKLVFVSIFENFNIFGHLSAFFAIKANLIFYGSITILLALI